MSREYASNPADLPRGTLVDLFLEAVERFGDAPALRYFVGDSDRLADLSYREVLEMVCAAAGGLAEMGLERGDRVALLSENRPAWAITDYGCICAGVVDVPIYDTLTASQVAYILENSEAKVVFASSREQMEKALEAGEMCPQDVRVVVFDDVGGLPDGVLHWERDFLASGRDRYQGLSDDDFAEMARKARPEEVTTLIYTSGTTGDPKGVMLTHDNLHSNIVASGTVLEVEPTDVTLSFLPLSHVLQRMVDYLLFTSGCTIAYAHDIDRVADDLKVVQPTIVVSVPRLYEKVYNKVMEAGGVKARLVQWAREVGAAWAEETLAGRRPTLALRTVHALADRLVFGKIRKGVGGKLRFFVSGGAPLEPAINRFFYGAGIVILEGYGLTETSPVTNVNPPDGVRIGTVGPPIPGTEIRIAEDGEILVRGPQVMKGYYKMPDATREVIDDDGWFRTGDVGELDDDGYLRITDRKKDIIVTAGGKNVAPQPLENQLKTNNFVEQLVMVGDKRKFVALLVVPAFGALETWAREEGIEVGDREALVRDEQVQRKMADEVLGGLGDLASYETPKKIALLTKEFTVEEGTLTPTQKVKRREVQARYHELIDRFYEPENVERDVLVPEG